MAIDYRQKARELCEAAKEFNHDADTERWIRQLSAEVLRDTTRYIANAKANELLRRRAAEIEAGR